MRIETERIYAKDIPYDSFVFLPKENKFIYVDFMERDGKNVNLYFEPTNNPDTWVTIVYPAYKKVIVFNPEFIDHLPITEKREKNPVKMDILQHYMVD